MKLGVEYGKRNKMLALSQSAIHFTKYLYISFFFLPHRENTYYSPIQFKHMAQSPAPLGDMKSFHLSSSQYDVI